MPPRAQAAATVTLELRKLGVPARLCAELHAFLNKRHPGNQERIYHSLAHTNEVAALTAKMLHSWPRVPAERKVLLILAAALHDLDPKRKPGTPARVEATLLYLHENKEALLLVADFCDRFHFTPGQVSALIMATDYSARADEMADKIDAFQKANRYAFGDDPWVDSWGRRLAYWDKIATYLHNTPLESRRRVAGLGRELRNSGVTLRNSSLREISRKFLAALSHDALFEYLPVADQARFKKLLRDFAPSRRKKRRLPSLQSRDKTSSRIRASRRRSTSSVQRSSAPQ